jgi:class 3 adenylate cyclase
MTTAGLRGCACACSRICMAETLRCAYLTGVKRAETQVGPARRHTMTCPVSGGAAMNVAAPSGVVTFLFTDIEGSTRRWETDADGMRAALASHDDLMRETVETHDGWLFKHTGDGVCAAFASPKSAIEAAVAAQHTLELPVRMGIATGEAELRDGDNFGTVLNRAARVMAAGHGGQILVADSAAGLLSGVELVDLGARRLRDVPNPVTVFQLHAPGLRSDFPPCEPSTPPLGIYGPPLPDSSAATLQSQIWSPRCDRAGWSR